MVQGRQTGPRGKFGFRDIPKKTIIMESKSKTIIMKTKNKGIILG